MSPLRPKVLIVKLADLGDALLATPAIAKMRRNLPDARLEVLTTATGAPAFEHSGLVDEVMVFDKQRYDTPRGLIGGPSAAMALREELRTRRPDALLVFHPMTTRFGALKHAGLALSTGAEVRAGLAREGSARWRSVYLSHKAKDHGFDESHVVEACERVAETGLRALGLETIQDCPADRHARFLLDSAAQAEAEAVLAKMEGAADHARSAGSWIAIHPGSGGFSEARRWPAERFALLIDRLHAQGHRCLVVGREADGGRAVMAACQRPPFDLIDQTPLPLLAAVLARMDALVANDGGVMHLATAMDTPVVAIFGPSNERYWGPWWPGHDREGASGPSPHRVLALDLACRPCFYRGHALGSKEGCPERDCLAWLQPETVQLALEDLLAE